ncbi:recombinase family protein [Bradyrhizobium sp. AUGA SZCCT0169]|uniref:recombinase family protein n=1 Tax=Bradyrhizobium sp. AUGA SZCCT0169 TaxID=2807663 RepID=UPI001BADE79A|nr:recombinase family protein [Bradyrhizobium sp. AUGA SZCCT0169]MBR1251335.1 recombinase family protein [Bradyrhizobium sp. AUGA SZCCT0169]
MQRETIPGSGTIGRRAAQYVRMSTDQQRYSTENQAAAIAAYALERNLTIVRTYIDQARSGLRFKNRIGLRGLISDIVDHKADFDFVLVYDISRWGRFQNIDESAYYEFICTQAGVRVLYCAEQFENDDSFASAILKALKRVGAGDYSRDLSVKVFAGSCRVAKQGFKQGGAAGFGLQRVLVDQFGVQKLVLARGDRKALQTDRVILQPGPAEDVETVRRVFRSFVRDRKSELTIARELNEAHIYNEFGRPWRMLAVRRLLTCEKYIGSYIYNRKSGKLKSRRTPNPPEMWIRRDNAFEGIITPKMFAAAGTIVDGRPRRTIRAWKSDSEMLDILRALWIEKGRLSANIIDTAADMPCHMTYIERFGSLRQAYDLIGYHPDAFKCYDARRAAVTMIGTVANDLLSKIQDAGRSAAFDEGSGRLVVATDLQVSILPVRCQRMEGGFLRWPVRRRIDLTPDLVLAVRMKEGNTMPLDYFLLPPARIPKGKLSFRRDCRPKLDSHRFATSDDLAKAILTEVEA